MTTDLDFPVDITRTQRKKSVSIQVKPNLVRVLAPKHLSEAKLQALIAKRRPWIQKQIAAIQKAPPFLPKEYINGECFNYLGNTYPLKVVASDANSVKLVQGHLKVSETPGANTKGLLEDWFRQEASVQLRSKTARYCEVIKVEPKSIRVKAYKARWGSCSSKGEVSYNWRIVMAPHEVIDYVVVHELSHLKELNHSPRFWRQVESICPDYRLHRTWLKHNGHLLKL